jgi:hypothetical protein
MRLSLRRYWLSCCATARSATFEYRVRRAGVLLASASIKVAGLDMERHVPAPFPAAVHAALARYLYTINASDDSGERARGGKIGIQIHSGEPTEVRVRSMRLKRLDG